MTAESYVSQGLALLPKGPAWPTGPDTLSGQLVAGWARGLARLDARIAALQDEADPRSTAELLIDWERDYGLPDECVLAFGGEQTIGQRRAALMASITSQGGQSIPYFVSVAAAIGHVVTIDEMHQATVDDSVDYPLYGADWNFVLVVNAGAETVTQWTVDDPIDQPLAWWGNSILECVLNHIKPAHTYMHFSYT